MGIVLTGHYWVAIYGQAVTKDEEIDGGDAVEHLVEWVTEAQEAMN